MKELAILKINGSRSVNNGSYVSLNEYVELQAKFDKLKSESDALAADNVALRNAHPQPFGPIMMQALDAYQAKEDEIPEQGMMDAFFILRDSINIKTPATDAYLNSVRDGVIKQLHSEQKEWALVTWQYDSFDALKRAAVRHGDSELSGVIFMLDRIEGFAAQLLAGKDGELWKS